MTAPPVSDPECRRDRILVVEDSPTQALKLRHVLETAGYQVEWATSAEAAFDILNERTPDLVIADFHLPGMNGDGLARQIRMNVQTRTLPVIMLTEASEREVERHGLESGADAYVPKSAPQTLLLLRIKALMRRRPGTAEAQEGSAGAGSPRYSTFRRASLLLVSDREPPDGAAAALARGLTARDAFAVSTAATAEAAFARLAEAPSAVDCVIVDLMSERFDGPALVTELDRLRAGPEGGGPAEPDFVLVALYDEERLSSAAVAEIYGSGVDDMVPATAEPDLLDLRIRALVRRKLLREENRRIESDFRARELAVERARADAEAAEARAALAGELEQANRDLAHTNQRLQETQSQLVHAAKMASLGELVAGIAHEINNPLAFVLAHHGTVERAVRTLADRVADDPEAAARAGKALDRLASMRVGLTRIQDLVLNLRKFSRLDEGDADTLDVPSSIETVLSLLSHKLGDGVTVTRRYEAEPTLVASPALLNQVVMNIIGNAADAIGDRGTIAIETRSDDRTYEIAISDDGPGVPPDLKNRIFEPFFTTKPVGAGTGLGLAISYGVVLAHNGDIAVETAPGGGARFVIRIPRRTP
ncbi:response regulator [Chthonobacter rhizosphaerae]|uniref:response regulator n=1 Tax=Chthonobacter rhizosphaerae TaxID=2735553 RepID=UPI0015EF01C4|nr:response regulator [Chthonobacter rhizosphaerae]